MMGRQAKRYVLLDRDGTLIEEKHYLSRPDQVVLVPGAGAGLRTLAENGFGLILVTNQSGIARGYFDLGALDSVHAVLIGMLEKESVALDGIFVCPHLPEDGCGCRKPLPGLALEAGRAFGFDPATAIVVGDKACDVELGRNISAATVLVQTGHGSEQTEGTRLSADCVVASIAEACSAILRWSGTGYWDARKDLQHG
jgi:D-glycero-D-manno-heptose 1,7-bisphosphate phosphatase